MKTFFSLTTRIIHTESSGGEVTLTLKILTGDIANISSIDKSNLDLYLEKLFQLIVNRELDECKFSIISCETGKISYDEIELAVFEKKLNIAAIAPITAQNVEISFSDDWYDNKDIVADNISHSFVSHICCLCVLQRVFETTSEIEKKTVFYDLKEKLRNICFLTVKKHHELNEELIGIAKRKHAIDENFNDYISVICK